jgi:thymidylate synthase (FAD)
MTQIQVLDHGYVEHIESWGTGKGGIGEDAYRGGPQFDYEAGIIEAARQSTQGSFRGWEADEKLLTMLYNNKHDTPFEFAGMVIEVRAPITVFREWHRHRTQCLTGATKIQLMSPRGTAFSRSIKNIYELKHGRPVGTGPTCHRNGYSKAGNPTTRRARWKDPDHVGALPNCQTRVLRTFDESVGRFRSGIMRDVWQSGIKEIWEVNTSLGKVFTSFQHPFLTRDGWATVGDLNVKDLLTTGGIVALQDRPYPPLLRQGIGVWTSMMRKRLIAPVDLCYVCGGSFGFDSLALDHVVPVIANLKLALDEQNLKPICSVCHRVKINAEQQLRQSKIGWGRRDIALLSKPIRVGEEMTYDLEMVGPDHNYIANGLVVHNSYNEASARYAPLPALDYMPTTERLLMVNAASKNKQEKGIGNVELTTDAAVRWKAELRQQYLDAEDLYQTGLKIGIAKELARLPMPVGHYSQMRAQATLRNWLAFLTLRMDPNAQWEIRAFANTVGIIIADQFPHTWKLFEGGRKKLVDSLKLLA